MLKTSMAHKVEQEEDFQTMPLFKCLLPPIYKFQKLNYTVQYGTTAQQNEKAYQITFFLCVETDTFSHPQTL